jgi:hypothetical protein
MQREEEEYKGGIKRSKRKRGGGGMRGKGKWEGGEGRRGRIKGCIRDGEKREENSKKRKRTEPTILFCFIILHL